MSRHGVPAVVLGGGLTALGVTRCLGRRGIPVRNLSPGGSILESCRWYRPLPGGYDPGVEEDPDLLVRYLESRDLDDAVLFPCSDFFAVTVASLPAHARGRFRTFLPEREVVERLIDKKGLAEIAERAGVPHPPTTMVQSEGQLQSLDERRFRRALLKPTDSLRFFQRFGRKSIPISGREEALEAYRDYFSDGDMEALLQGYVPGPPSAHLFLDGYRTRSGEMVGLLARQRERMYPMATGNSSSMVTIPLSRAREAAGHLATLLESAGFHGIFSAEFKRDGSDDIVRLIEVNVRPWWYVEFTARCGVDVCSMAYREALGESIEADDSYQVGRRCVHAYYDFFAGREEIRAGRLSAWRWIQSWIGSDRPVFARDDPAPAIEQTMRRVREFIRSRVGGWFPLLLTLRLARGTVEGGMMA